MISPFKLSLEGLRRDEYTIVRSPEPIVECPLDSTALHEHDENRLACARGHVWFVCPIFPSSSADPRDH